MNYKKIYMFNFARYLVLWMMCIAFTDAKEVHPIIGMFLIGMSTWIVGDTEVASLRTQSVIRLLNELNKSDISRNLMKHINFFRALAIAVVLLAVISYAWPYAHLGFYGELRKYQTEMGFLGFIAMSIALNYEVHLIFNKMDSQAREIFRKQKESI